jgi:hypothetical protein
MYGFDRPQGTLVLRSGETATSLILGGRANENDVYARDPSKALVATIDDGLLDELNKAPDEFRRKQVFALNRFSTNRLEFTRDGQTTTFEKTMPEGQPEKWSRVGPVAGEPDGMNMETLLTALESLRAGSFTSATDKTAPANPSLTVYARFEGTKEERVAFARPAASDDVYATIPGEPGAAVIPATSFDELLKALDAVSK